MKPITTNRNTKRLFTILILLFLVDIIRYISYMKLIRTTRNHKFILFDYTFS
jgi:hypothetical protein